MLINNRAGQDPEKRCVFVKTSWSRFNIRISISDRISTPPMEDKTILQLIAITIFIYVTSHLLSSSPHRQKPVLRSVAILVLGDIGRSPRMMYHAESFAKNEYETFLIGYRGVSPNIPLRAKLNIYKAPNQTHPSSPSLTSASSTSPHPQNH
jgi:hypothetical protein